MSNFLLIATDLVTGGPCGIAADLGRELGQRLDVSVALLPYPNPGELADAATVGVWDVGFLGAELQRAHAIDFTASYMKIEATYLVPVRSKNSNTSLQGSASGPPRFRRSSLITIG